MNALTYPVGAVAVATVRGVEGIRVLRSAGLVADDFWWSADFVKHDRMHDDEHLTDVRPLVVLDFKSVAAESIVRTLRERHEVALGEGTTPATGWALIADQIEAQTRPPKPAEPTGLGAVVECRDHSPLTRASTAIRGELVWVGNNGDWHTWDELDVVKVLSEGWTP